MSPACALSIRTILAGRRGRRDGWAVFVVVLDALLFVLFVAAAIVLRSHVLRMLAGLAAGFVTLRLASIAHDAGQHSYTSRRSWNKIIARAAFFPALQPFATWRWRTI